MFEMCHTLSEYLSIQPPSRQPFTVGPRDQLNQIVNIVGVLKNGCNQFMPLLMKKLTDIIPRIISPMLQSPPEDTNQSMGNANIDIFDGFGGSTISHPPPMQMQMDTDYDRKFSAAEYDSMANNHVGTPGSSQSNPTIAPSRPELNSQFVSSPGIMSPSMEYPQAINDYACSESVMSPMSAGPGMSLNGPGTMHQPSPHHLQSMQGHLGNMGQQSVSMSGMSPQNLHGAQSHNAMGQVPRPPHRTNSFAMSQQSGPGGTPVPRTVGEFQALQRTNSEGNPTPTMGNMAPLGIEMDYGGMR